jgi:hypothetical protein
MSARNATLDIEPSPIQATSADLDRKIAALINCAGLSSSENRFFKAAKAVKTVDGRAALSIAHYWRETTKTFMFTTIAGIGGMARQAELDPSPPEHFLDVIQTAFRVIGDDLNNALPVFQAVAPAGAAGIHYVWWERSILQPIADCLGLGPSNAHVALPANVRALLDNMHRLSSNPLGTAVQLRVVEAIALDICIAFKRVFSRVATDGGRVFTTADQLAWMNSHIQAEVAHNQQVSDHDTGMTNLADTAAKQKEMLRLTAEYVRNWNAALEDFAAALE